MERQINKTENKVAERDREKEMEEAATRRLAMAERCWQRRMAQTEKGVVSRRYEAAL